MGKNIFKEYIRINSGANTKDKYLELLECQTAADYLAQKFNKLPTLANLTAVVKRIKFVMAKLVFEPLSEGKFRNLTMERFIEGSYKKFSNNAGFVNYDDPAITLQAFSHWTHESTNGDMIVVDLQGIVVNDNQTYLLTDPCIHSIDLKRFGRANLGKPGIKRFFQTHVCNIICHALQLKRHEHQLDIKASTYDSHFVKRANVTMFN
jgi:myosin-heavy-chain kinase